MSSIPSSGRFLHLSAIWLGQLLALGCALLASCGGTNSEKSGSTENSGTRADAAQVISEYLKRDAAPYRQTKVRLTISSTSQPSQVYELEIWRKQAGDETLTLTRVVEPAEQDVAALTIERKGEDAISVVYLAGGDRFRETGTNKSFFGGVTTQEFLGEWDKYDFRLVNEKDLDGVKSFDIEGQLKPKRDSNIAKLRALFRGDTYLPAEIHALNSDGQELRTFRVTAYRSFEGRTVVGRMEIQNHIYHTTVVVEVLNMRFPDKMDDRVFTREHLKQIAKR